MIIIWKIFNVCYYKYIQQIKTNKGKMVYINKIFYSVYTFVFYSDQIYQ